MKIQLQYEKPEKIFLVAMIMFIDLSLFSLTFLQLSLFILQTMNFLCRLPLFNLSSARGQIRIFLGHYFTF